MSRACECGCGESLEGRHPSARFYDDRCRARAWKAAHHYGRRDRPRERRANGQRRPDLRISYRKAVEAVEALLVEVNNSEAELRAFAPGPPVAPWRVPELARETLAPLLSERQREALRAKGEGVT